MEAIKTDQLTKYYGRTKGIEDLNLTVEEGEIFGFIGPNGAGKTTTIRTLLTLIRATSGEAHILGHRVPQDAKKIMRRIGYVPAEVEYYDKMRVGKLLKYSAHFFGRKLDSWYDELVEDFQLNLTKRIEDCSTGNKKKVAIIQSILHQPQLLILDEPTSGLDPLMQEKLYQLLRRMNAHGTTIFFSSHVLQEVEKICSRVAIIKDGFILETEEINTLRAKHVKKDRNAVEPSLEEIFTHYYEK